MKKNFVKKLALAMALTLAVGSVPSMNVEAAAAPAFKSTKVNLKVGQTKKYNTVNSTKKSVKFVIGNKKIATVDYKKGNKYCHITGVAAGKTRVRAEFKDYKTKDVITKKLDVEVKAAETEIKTVVQNTTTKLTATFAGDTSAVKAENFSIVREDNAVVAVKSVAVDKTDATKVVIETYADMKDGKTYTVTFNAKSNAQFVATDGTVVNVNVNPLVITAAKATTIKVDTLDANNVIIGTYTMDDAAANNLEFTVDTVDGYVDGDKLYLTEVGKTAKVTIVYHTYDYDEVGNEKGQFTRDFTITAVKDATVISNFAYTIAGKAPEWDSTSFKANTTIAVDDEKMNVYFNIKDSEGNAIEYAEYANYKFASSDTSKLIVDESAELAGNDSPVEVTAVAPGTAYILVKNTDGNTIKTLPVTVVAARKASVLTVDRSAVVLSNGAEAEDVQSINLTLKDQYGDEMDADKVEVEVVKTPTKSTWDEDYKDLKAEIEIEDNKTVAFYGEDFTGDNAGNYTFKVVATKNNVSVNRTVSLTVKTPSEKISKYDLVIAGLDAKNSIDLAVAADVDNDADALSKLGFSIVGKDSNGVLVKTISTEDEDVASIKYTVKHSSGTELTKQVTTTTTSGAISLTVVSGSSITVNDNVKTGSYTVTAEIKMNDEKETVKKLVKTFTVADTQVAPTLTIKSTKFTGDIDNALDCSDDIIYSYDGRKNEELNVSVIDVDDKTVGNSSFVKAVTIKYEVGKGKNVYRTVTLDVNKSFTKVQ